MSKKKLEEKYGKDTAKAIGTVLGLTKKDYTGQNVPRGKRAKDNIIDFAQTAAASSTLMGGVGPKSLIVPTSILASKVIGTRRAIKQHEKLMAQRSKEKEEMSNTVAEAIDHIINKNYDAANNLLEEQITTVLKSKLHEMKKIVAAHQFNEAVVWPDGKVHTATGEMILPSIWRHRRGLTESNVERERFGKQAKETLGTEESYENLRSKEINTANLGGESIRDYLKRKNEYFTKAADSAIREKGENIQDAAKHMHSLVSGVENKKQPWMHMIGGKWEDLHPSVRTDFEMRIRKHLDEKEKMKDPEYVRKTAEASRRGDEAEKRIKEIQKQHNDALAAHQRKQAGIKDPDPSKPKKTGKDITGDEIPFEE